MMTNYVEINHIQKQINDFQFGPINLKIEPGTITALVGNNGSGKSTLLKLMMNLVNPDLGRITIFGKSVYGQDESWKKNVAYQPQTMIGWDGFDGKTLKDLISSLYPNWDENRFKEIVNLFDIPLDKKFSKLSQGMQQKLNVALTIPRNAPLLILDEPTSFMDIPSKKYLTDILVEWMDEGDRAIIIASHQIDDIRKLSDYLFVLHDGQMIGHFEKESLTDSYQRFWMKDDLPDKVIPGEILRNGFQLVSNQANATESFLNDKGLEWLERTSLDLEEIISLMLTKKKGKLKK